MAAVREYLERDLAVRELVTIGPRAARAIAGVAARTRLRAADATYVWVASSRGLPLVTLDRETRRSSARGARSKSRKSLGWHTPSLQIAASRCPSSRRSASGALASVRLSGRSR
jgi:hypothetical protein